MTKQSLKSREITGTVAFRNVENIVQRNFIPSLTHAFRKAENFQAEPDFLFFSSSGFV